MVTERGDPSEWLTVWTWDLHLPHRVWQQLLVLCPFSESLCSVSHRMGAGGCFTLVSCDLTCSGWALAIPQTSGAAQAAGTTWLSGLRREGQRWNKVLDAQVNHGGVSSSH